MTAPGRGAERLGYLDTLRGVAALVVAALHHYPQMAPAGSATAALPLPLHQIWPFRLSYDFGWLAVDFFFVLSGIVFAHTYARRIATGEVGGRAFFVLRFSRLYPIHFATLLVTAGLATAYHAQYGTWPIYQLNDARHFILNVFFLQRVGLDAGYSFNGPAWSLSIEAVMYLLFFLACRAGRYRDASAVMAMVGVALAHRLAAPVSTVPLEMGRGLGGFFLGCLLYQHVLGKPRRERLVLVLLPLVAVALYKLGLFDIYLQAWCLFGWTVTLVSTLAPLRRLLSARPLTRFGDISLGVYLLHIPLEIALLLGFRSQGMMPPVTSGWFLAAYTATIIGIAAVVHYTFERPMQRAIRTRFMSASAR